MKSMPIAIALLGANLNPCSSPPRSTAQGDLRTKEQVDNEKNARFECANIEWQTKPEAPLLTWEQAQSRCLQKSGGWRMPSCVELKLLFEGRPNYQRDPADTNPEPVKPCTLPTALPPLGLFSSRYWCDDATQPTDRAQVVEFSQLKTGGGPMFTPASGLVPPTPPSTVPLQERAQVRCVRDGPP